MRTRKQTLIPLLIAFFLLLTACSPDSIHEIPKEDKNLTDESKQASFTEPGEISSEFRDSLFHFAWNLFRESSRNEGNVLISPASVYLALGMTYNGAENQTREDMAEALGAAGLSEEEFNAACRDYISILLTKGNKTELSIGNSIWYRDGIKVDKGFIQQNKDSFQAAVQGLDFNKPKAVNTINDWVKKETRNTIDKIVDQIDPDVVMYLINAVYFKSDWQVPFSANDTRDADFNGSDRKINAKFMNRTGEMDYIRKDGVNGVVLPYDDGRFQFFALLPEEGQDVRSFINELDGAKIYDYLTSVQSDRIVLSLPKFETRFEDSLVNELTGLGMGSAFNGAQADFSRMVEDPNLELFISEVKHKTFCRVDELGTEASAVTSVEMRATGAFIEPEIKISFDRPFVYGIADTVTSAPLFLGIMENPSEQ